MCYTLSSLPAFHHGGGGGLGLRRGYKPLPGSTVKRGQQNAATGDGIPRGGPQAFAFPLLSWGRYDFVNFGPSLHQHFLFSHGALKLYFAAVLNFIRDANDGSGGQGHSALGKDETLLLFLVPISYCTRREGMLLYLLWITVAVFVEELFRPSPCGHIHSEHGRCVRPRTLWYETGAATTRDKRIGESRR